MTKPRVLLVDDDETLVRLLSFALEQEGFEVAVARNGAEAVSETGETQPDLVILDIMMPVMDGWEACARIRELSDAPVVILSAKPTESDVVRGLELGADDYVKKPFGVQELLARLQALLRRSRSASPGERPAVLIEGGLKIDKIRHTATLDDQPIQLTPTEFKLLTFLLENSGRAVSQEEILIQVWGPEYAREKQYLKLFVHTLKKKIEADPARPRYLHTVRGVGYRLEQIPLAGA
jgi:DNA-binding response OmpR family regulator